MGLTTGLFGHLPFYPAVLPDATNIASWTSGGAATSVFDYEDVQTTGKLLRLRNLQLATPTTYPTSITVTADSYITPAVDAATIGKATVAGAIPSAWGNVHNAAAGRKLRATALNSTGGTITNQWFSWGVQVGRPTIAEKLLLPGLFPVSSDERALADKYSIGSRGVLPRTLDWIIANEFATQIVDAVVLGQVMGATTTRQTWIQESARANEVLVLAGLWMSPGSGTDALTLQVGIDNNTNLYQVAAYGLGQGVPQPCFLMGRQQIVLQANANTTVSNVNVSAVIWHCRLTDEIRVRLGDIQSGADVEKITVGVI